MTTTVANWCSDRGVTGSSASTGQGVAAHVRASTESRRGRKQLTNDCITEL